MIRGLWHKEIIPWCLSLLCYNCGSGELDEYRLAESLGEIPEDPLNLIRIMPAASAAGLTRLMCREGIMKSIESVVQTVFLDQQKHLGFVHPNFATSAIAEGLEIEDPRIKQDIAQVIFEHPTGEFVHEGVFAALSELIIPQDPATHPGVVAIWTDDYSIRLASSGVGQFRKDLPHAVRSRLRVAFDPVDKVSLLPSLATRAASEQYGQFIVVDDSMKNLVNAAQQLHEAQVPIPFALVYLDPRMQEASDEYIQGPSYRTHTITHLPFIRDSMPSQPTFWAIDFNGPILDREAYTDARMVEVVSRINKAF